MSCADTMQSSTPVRGGRAKRVTNLTKPAPLKRQLNADKADATSTCITSANSIVADPAPQKREKEGEKENVKVPLTFSARKSSRKIKLEKPAPLKSSTILTDKLEKPAPLKSSTTLTDKLEKPAPLKSSTILTDKLQNGGIGERVVSPRTAETRASKLISEVVSVDVNGDNGCDPSNPRATLLSNTSVDSGLGDLDDGSMHARKSSANSYSRLCSSSSNYSRQSSTSDYSRQFSTPSDYSRQTSSTSQDDIDWDNIDEDPVPFALETDQLKCLPYYMNQACPYSSVSVGDNVTDKKHRKHTSYRSERSDSDTQKSGLESGASDSGDSSNLATGDSSNLATGDYGTDTPPASESPRLGDNSVEKPNCDMYLPPESTTSLHPVIPPADTSRDAVVAGGKLAAPATDDWEAECVITDVNQNSISSDVNNSFDETCERVNNLSFDAKPATQIEILDYSGIDNHDKFVETLHSMIPQLVAPVVDSVAGYCENEIMHMYDTRADAEADTSPICQPPPQLNGIRQFWNVKVTKVREPLGPTSMLKDIWAVEESLPSGLYSARGRRKMFRNYAVCRQEQPEPVETARIQYSADRLLELGASELCHQVPDCWSYLVNVFPEVCLPQIVAAKCLNTEWYRQERQYVVEQYNVIPQRSSQPHSAGDPTRRVRFTFPTTNHMSSGFTHTTPAPKMADLDIDTKCDISVRGGFKMLSSPATSTPGFMRQQSCPVLWGWEEPRFAEMEVDYKIMDFRERQKLGETPESNVSNNAITSPDDSDIVNKDLPEKCPW